jgi:uncharacterized protein (TIGR00255 family)
MIRSMTGFARTEASAPWGSLSWELRSVNHRYLESSFRLPEELRGLEAEFRQLVAGRLRRGKVDCSLRLSWDSGSGAALELDLDLALQISSATERIRERVGGGQAPTAMELLRWPGVAREPSRDVEPAAGLARESLAAALEELDAARAREGERLGAMLGERCDGIATFCAEVRERLPSIRDGLKRRFAERLAAVDVQADPQRLEQEIAIQLTKMDVDEELDRLDSHVAEVRRILADPGANGRRLDFLMQEFNRECNTLASKSVDTQTTRLAVDLKVLVEQMREQAQNVE